MSSETTVEYRRLGRAGLRVSVPIVGAMSFGSSKWAPWIVEEEEGLKLLKAAWDRGVNTIDTANIYSNGESERIIAKFIEKFQIPRNEIIILTKCYNLVPKVPSIAPPHHWELRDDPQYVNQSGLSRQAIFNAVEASLQRLNTTYIDLLQIHRFDPKVEAEETMKALHDLVQSGKVRYIGASSMRCWQFAHLNEVARRNGWTTFVSMQDEHSLLYREEEREMFAYCNFHGIGIIPWAPLAGGDLARPWGTTSIRTDSTKGSVFEQQLTSADEAIIKRVEELAKKHGKKMSQIALAWSNAKVTSPIVGCSSVQRLEESLIGKFTLSEEEVKSLQEPYVPKVVRGHM